MKRGNPYRHGNGRIQMRNGHGEFRQANLSDFGLGSVVCPQCGDLNTYDLQSPVKEGGFVLMKHNEPPTVCRACGAALDGAE